MTKYNSEFSREFKKDLKKIRSDFDLQKKLEGKIEAILEEPHHYKILRNILKSKRRAHIGSFVLIFRVIEDEKMVIFESLKHHDEAYE
ncbi:MAG: type II toxin-antitoxin system mRNA interferase toxin, RelE/StbE family [Deltaproteobacteria bacterium]|nr:type II toxin-antitoxin system mRNA interferase toxin, RelE/StbE family [Deltaproteobacteria bacterium]